MAIGLGAFRKKREEEQSNRGTKFLPQLKLQDKQSAVVRFNGGADEPQIRDCHTASIMVKGADGKPIAGRDGKPFHRYDKITCAESEAKHEGCVACYRVTEGDKSIRRPSMMTTFNVASSRWMHKVAKTKTQKKLGKDVIIPVKKQDGTPVMISAPCEGKICGYCAKKVEKEREGQLILDMSGMFAETLDGILVSLAQKCACCFKGEDSDESGEIEHKGWACPECAEEIESFDPEGDETVVECGSCGESVEPKEVVECSNSCDDARRITIFDGNWKILRTGDKKSTNYAFTFLGVSDLPDWAADLDPYDLAPYVRPLSAARMAEKLQCQNPFRNGGGKTARHTEETVGYDDVEPAPKGKGKQGADEEEEQEEASEDPFDQ